jgi:hypothetical protein
LSNDTDGSLGPILRSAITRKTHCEGKAAKQGMVFNVLSHPEGHGYFFSYLTSFLKGESAAGRAD